MGGWWHKLAFRWLAREETVPIADCVHFCGFRYGRGEYNPYETYLRMAVGPEGPARARERFNEFLQHFRPADFGAALGLDLSRRYPLWLYPWSRRNPARSGWQDDPDDCPDILTHFSARGILRWRAEEELGWLNRALASIREHGYQPAKFGSAIAARRFIRGDGRTAWLLLDGNHRVSALSALGTERVVVRYLPPATVRETDLPRWVQVRNGVYDPGDAARVFRVHFDGNLRPRTTDRPAPFLEEKA